MKNRTKFAGAVAAFAGTYGLFSPGGRLLCALSGGADSMALLTVLEELAGAVPFTLLAAHYNHGLRGEEANRDEAFVKTWCAARGIPLTVGRGDVAERARALGQGVEETARQLRYAFLEEAADALGADRIATAHNAEDNVETILLHLTRGAGLDGLLGIPPRRGRLIRPLLTQSRADIEAYLSQEGIPHVEDSSNGDLTYARNRLRRQVLPVLRSINPNLAATVAGALPSLRADRAVLEAQASKLTQRARRLGSSLRLPTAPLIQAPEPIALRALKLLLAQAGQPQISAAHLSGALALARGENPSAVLSLPGGLILHRIYGELVFSREDPQPAFRPTPLPPGQTILPAGTDWSLRWEEAICPESPVSAAGVYYLAPGLPPVTARPRRQGDILRLPGRREKSLKKWCIDEKIPRLLRDRLPVLEDGRGLLAVGGLGPAADRLAAPGHPAWRFTVTPIPPQATQKDRKG